jgi:hypothetical protein
VVEKVISRIIADPGRVVPDGARSLLLQYFVISGMSELPSFSDSSVASIIKSSQTVRAYKEYLTSESILCTEPAGGLRISRSAAAKLTASGKNSIVSMVHHEWRQQRLWIDLDKTLRGCHRENQQDYTLSHDPARLGTLLAAMREVDRELGRTLAGLPWPEGAHVWDIAGGHGFNLASVLSSNSTLSGTVVDFPGAEKIVRRVSQESGVVMDFLARDLTAMNFLDSAGHDQSVVLFSRCLHNFSRSFRSAVYQYALARAGEGMQLVVVNPNWDWGAEGFALNPSVAQFSFYMAVNAVGGGVPRRSMLWQELQMYGTVKHVPASPSVDIFIVGSGDSNSPEIANLSNSIPPDSPAESAELYDTLVDEFISVSLLMGVLEWKIDRYMSTARTTWELEKFLGLPDGAVEGVLAGLGSMGWVLRSSSSRFIWNASVVLDEVPSLQTQLNTFRTAWRELSDAAGSDVDHTTIRKFLAMIH